MPPGMARKRIWNRKYPVCVTLAEGEVGEESVVEGQEEEERAERLPAPDHQLPVTLYLFGRTGREKEEWFQHLLLASRAGTKSSVSGEESAGKDMFGGWEQFSNITSLIQTCVQLLLNRVNLLAIRVFLRVKWGVIQGIFSDR